MSMSMCQCQSKIVNVARIAELLRSPRRRSHRTTLGKDWRKRNVLRRWRKTGRDGDDWMSDGNEFQRSDAATGNVRRPTVVSRNGGTSNWCDDDERSRRRPGRSATRTRSFRYILWRETMQHTKWHGPPSNRLVVVDAASDRTIKYIVFSRYV